MSDYASCFTDTGWRTVIVEHDSRITGAVSFTILEPVHPAPEEQD